MKKSILIASLISVFCFLNAAVAHPPSTLSIRYTGTATASTVNNTAITSNSIETLPTGNGSSDQFLVFAAGSSRCVISKAAAAKQGVSIEMLNDLANRYQVEVTCVYVYPLQPGQVAANDFGFRASMRSMW